MEVEVAGEGREERMSGEARRKGSGW